MVGAEPLPSQERRPTGEQEMPINPHPVKLVPGNWIALVVIGMTLIGGAWALATFIFATKTEMEAVDSKAAASHTLATENKKDIEKHEKKLDVQQRTLHRIDKNVAIIGGRRIGIVKPPDRPDHD